MKPIKSKVLRLALLTGLVMISGLDCFAHPSSSLVKPAGYKAKSPTASSAKGKTLFEENNCKVCHTISGRGGCLAPPLDGIGSRRTPKFISLRITSGESAANKFADLYGKTELMPHVRVPASTANAIAKYLLTLKEPKHGFKIIGHKDAQAGSDKNEKTIPITDGALARGRELLSSKGCLACHSFGNLGGTFAVKFNGVGSRLTAEAIRKQISDAQLLTLEDDPEYGARGTTMPPLDLSEKDIDDLSAYLSSLK